MILGKGALLLHTSKSLIRNTLISLNLVKIFPVVKTKHRYKVKLIGLDFLFDEWQIYIRTEYL